MIDVGDPLPEFSLPEAGGGTLSSADLAGQTVVLYAYPRADTPGCTVQASDFTSMKSEFADAGAVVVGVSKDPVAKLDKFAAKHDLSLHLVSDADGDLCERLGVWKEKSMYGKTYMGIERSTFVAGPDGKLVHVARKVRPKGHAEAILELVKGL